MHLRHEVVLASVEEIQTLKLGRADLAQYNMTNTMDTSSIKHKLITAVKSIHLVKRNGLNYGPMNYGYSVAEVLIVCACNSKIQNLDGT